MANPIDDLGARLERRIDALEQALREQWQTTAGVLSRVEESRTTVDRRLDGLEHGLREAWSTVETSLTQLQSGELETPEGPQLFVPPRALRDQLGADFDTSPPRSGPPEQVYIVCSTPRSGSTLLCRGLTAVGGAGVLIEYFTPGPREELCERWGKHPGSLSQYLAGLYAHRTTHAGVFGTKLHFESMRLLRSELLGLPEAEPPYGVSADFLDDVFPGADIRFVHIARIDVDQQAVSLWKAVRTGVFSQAASHSDLAADVPYSFEGIDRCRRIVENMEVHWERFFAANRIDPLRVTYEQLDAAYEETIERVARFVVPDARNIRVPPPTTHRQADERSTLMVEQFIADREERGLPDPRRV